MICSFMFTLDEVEILSTEIKLPKNIGFTEVMEHIESFVVKEGIDFNKIKGLSVLIKS